MTSIKIALPEGKIIEKSSQIHPKIKSHAKVYDTHKNPILLPPVDK